MYWKMPLDSNLVVIQNNGKFCPFALKEDAPEGTVPEFWDSNQRFVPHVWVRKPSFN